MPFIKLMFSIDMIPSLSSSKREKIDLKAFFFWFSYIFYVFFDGRDDWENMFLVDELMCCFDRVGWVFLVRFFREYDTVGFGICLNVYSLK